MSRIFCHHKADFLTDGEPVATKKKATPKDGFGHAFGNEDFELLQTLVKQINLAEEVAANNKIS